MDITDINGWLIRIPEGWVPLVRTMINKCIELDPDYTLYDLKEKYGVLSVFSNASTDQISNIEQQAEETSAVTCWRCGAPATKYSTGWILPWCDDCAMEEKYENYKPIK